MTLTPRPGFAKFRDDYGSLDYRGAVVLDIGADYGCTPEWFLERGAERVVALEKRPDWRRRLESWAEGRPVEVADPLSADNAERLLIEIRPDVVKVDCEGCERHLLDVSADALRIPRAWVMETHHADDFRRFKVLFASLGYDVSVVWSTEDRAGEAHRAVIRASRPSQT